jgi:hypothetical protein
MPKRAAVTSERGEHHAALVRLVLVVEQVAGDAGSLVRRAVHDIGAMPYSAAAATLGFPAWAP